LDRWHDLDNKEPGFTISPMCPHLIWEWERLRYKEITTAMIEKQNPSEQLIDKDNHSWDDWKYFISSYIYSPDKSARPEPSFHSPRAMADRVRRKTWR